MATKITRHVLLLCVLLAQPLSVGSDPGQDSGETDPDAAGREWDFRFWLPKFERQASTRDDDGHGEWAGSIAVGDQRNTFWLATKGSTQAGNTDSSEIRLFYSRSIVPNMEWHLGWRHDIRPAPERGWLGFGVLAVLPYKVGADISIFLGESERLAARLEMAYLHRVTPKLSLLSDLEANFYSEEEPDRDTGSGLSDLDLGLRLRYQVAAGLFPYTGITWKGNFGNSADVIDSPEEDTADLRLLLGVSLRY